MSWPRIKWPDEFPLRRVLLLSFCRVNMKSRTLNDERKRLTEQRKADNEVLSERDQ